VRRYDRRRIAVRLNERGSVVDRELDLFADTAGALERLAGNP
jgi:hypothetical protein